MATLTTTCALNLTHRQIDINIMRVFFVLWGIKHTSTSHCAYLVENALDGFTRLLVACVLKRRHAAIIDEVHRRIQLRQPRLQGAHVFAGNSLENLFLHVGQRDGRRRSSACGSHCVRGRLLATVDAGGCCNDELLWC